MKEIMGTESFQPISVKPPAASPLLFAIRCFFDVQLGTIAKFLRPAVAEFPKGDIIDIGAGESPWRDWLPQHCRYHGIDVRNAGEFGMQARGGDVVLYDGGEMPFTDGRFDGAFCIEVLEHADDPEKLIAEIARILKDGAPLLLSVPWSARRHHIPHDYHRFTKERLDQLFRKHNFSNVIIAERGNDIAVIANKLIVVTIRVIKTTSLLNIILHIPLMIFFGGLSSIMLLAAHLSMVMRRGGNEDPLGYFCTATKSKHRDC